MRHVDALSRNFPGNIKLTVVIIDECDWFLTVQLQDRKARELVRMLKSGTDNSDIRTNYMIGQRRLYRKTSEGDRLQVPAMARFCIKKT